jgi:hypothetical protein
MMVKTQALREIISLALATPYVKNEKPVSLLILAKPESGKTQTLKEFTINNGICWLSDVTYTGLVNIMYRIKEGNVKTLLIPDMLKVFGKNINTKTNFLTLLNELIEEGVKVLMTYDKSIDFGEFVRCNTICAVTSTDFFTSRRMLGGIGFLSRIIPFSYSYSIQDVNKIFLSLMKSSNSTEFQKLKLPKTKKDVSINLSLCKRIKENITLHLVERYVRKVSQDIYGFRLQKNLQTLAKASALLRGQKKVSIKDINLLEKLSNWINYDFHEL